MAESMTWGIRTAAPALSKNTNKTFKHVYTISAIHSPTTTDERTPQVHFLSLKSHSSWAARANCSETVPTGNLICCRDLGTGDVHFYHEVEKKKQCKSANHLRDPKCSFLPLTSILNQLQFSIHNSRSNHHFKTLCGQYLESLMYL